MATQTQERINDYATIDLKHRYTNKKYQLSPTLGFVNQFNSFAEIEKYYQQAQNNDLFLLERIYCTL